MLIKPLLINTIRQFFLNKKLRLAKTISRQDLSYFFDLISPKITNHCLIRVGGQDGGYLIPDDLVGIKYCYSPGVSNIADFELELSEKKIISYMADYSVDRPPFQNDYFVFTKKFLGTENKDNFITLDEWMDSTSNSDGDCLMQMDIEGYEYGVLLNTSEKNLEKFRILAIEFHNFDAIVERTGYELIKHVFKKLLKTHSIVHIHPNNYYSPLEYLGYQIPPVLEFTFLRNDRIKNSAPNLGFPHILDLKNVKQIKDYDLPKCWYQR